MAGEKLLKNQKGGNRARLRPVVLDDATARRGAQTLASSATLG